MLLERRRGSCLSYFSSHLQATIPPAELGRSSGSHSYFFPISDFIGARPDTASLGRYLVARVDANDDIAEDDENNNSDAIGFFDYEMNTDTVRAFTGSIEGSYNLTEDLPDGSNPPLLQLYWSQDDTWDASDSPASDPYVLSSQAGDYKSFDFNSNAYGVTAPKKEHQYLIGVIDPDDRINEWREDNNFFVLEVSSVADLKVEFRPPQKPLFFKDTLHVELDVTNLSPFPLNYRLAASFASDAAEMEVPANIDEVITIMPGITEPYAFDVKLTWDWIPKENPLRTADSKWIADYLFDAVGDVGKFWTPAKVAAHLSTASDYVIDLQGAWEYYDKQIKVANISFTSLIEPEVFQAEGVEQTQSFDVSITEERLKAFDKFYASTVTLQTALALISVATPNMGNKVASVVERAWLALGTLDDDWNAAYDTPDPEFTQFPTPDFHIPEDVAALPNGPIREWAMRTSMVVGLQEAFLAATNKKNGAVDADDSLWHVNQLLVASNLEHRAAFSVARAAALEALVDQAYRDDFVDADDAAATLQAEGLPPDLRDQLVRGEWPEATINQIDTTLRSVVADDIRGLNENTSVAARYLEYNATAANSIGLLSEAIRIRTVKLGLPQGTLSETDKSQLDDFREALQEKVDGDSPSSGMIELAERYAAEARRFALATNNFSELEDHLQSAYAFLLNEPVRFAGFGAWISKIDEAFDSNRINTDLANQFRESALEIENLIRSEEWSEIEAKLAVLRDQVFTESEDRINALVQGNLVRYLDFLQETLNQTAGLPFPSLQNTPSSMLVHKGQSLNFANGSVVSDPALGDFTGGWIDVSLVDGPTDATLGIESEGLFEFTAEGEILFDGQTIGQIDGGQSTGLNVVLHSGSTAEMVSDLLQQVYVVGSSQRAAPDSIIEVQVGDGVGGMSSVKTILVDHVLTFSNLSLPADVNDSGDVTPIDALLIINALGWSRSGGIEVGGVGLRKLPPLPAYPDVSGDDAVTPLDALRVINELRRRQANPAADGEQSAVLLGSTNTTWRLHSSIIRNDRIPTPGILTSKLITVSEANQDESETAMRYVALESRREPTSFVAVDEILSSETFSRELELLV